MNALRLHHFDNGITKPGAGITFDEEKLDRFFRQIAKKNNDWEPQGALSNVILLGDSYLAEDVWKCQFARLNAGNTNKIHLRHNNRANTLMCDGSGRALSSGAIVTTHKGSLGGIVDEQLVPLQ